MNTTEHVKVQSSKEYVKGTILEDEGTGEFFEVTECIKFFMHSGHEFGLTLKPITGETINIYNK